MIEDFNCITINGGMFSPEFLIKVADGNATVEGANPSTYGHQDSQDLNNYISGFGKRGRVNTRHQNDSR